MTVLGLPVCHAVLAVGGAGSLPVAHHTKVAGRWVWPSLLSHHATVAGRWEEQRCVHVMPGGLVCEPEASPCTSVCNLSYSIELSLSHPIESSLSYH